MKRQSSKRLTILSLLLACALEVSCSSKDAATTSASTARPAELSPSGSIVLTAQLVEIPEGAIFKRDLYDYATVLKYKVLNVEQGKVEGETIYVGHYNPFKPRSEAADQRVPKLGGNLKSFRAGQVHRMALEVPIDDFFMGGVVNKYFGKETGPIYWAMATNLVRD
jgi:hypothetical protein